MTLMVLFDSGTPRDAYLQGFAHPEGEIATIKAASAANARAVLVGRPILWGLAVGGEAGVKSVLEMLRQEFDLAMALSSCPRLTSITRDLVRPCRIGDRFGAVQAPSRSNCRRARSQCAIEQSLVKPLGLRDLLGVGSRTIQRCRHNGRISDPVVCAPNVQIASSRSLHTPRLVTRAVARQLTPALTLNARAL